jgi:arylamine N-acetyltransferase
MTDDWSVGKLDLDAYLARIGYAGPAGPSEEALTALHRAHLAAIPFENLDILLGRDIRVDLESIQAKLVYARRGGYCYEHGQLFGAALERLGFSVDRLRWRCAIRAPAVRRTWTAGCTRSSPASPTEPASCANSRTPAGSRSIASKTSVCTRPTW